MKNELIHTLTESFEGHAQQTDNGVEFWLARDLQHLLGYGKWDNFQGVISKAKTACELSGHGIADHFADVGKMIQLGKGGQHEVSVTLLSRGIRPESLPPAEDVKKVECRLTSAEKKALKKIPEGLDE
jgi:DNA-damage-inducible protein D